MSTADKAIFLDRDGTIMFEEGYIDNVNDVRLLPGAVDALAQAKILGFKLVVVTNQSGVARGMFPESKVIEINQMLCEILEQSGVSFDGIYYCPHHPEGKQHEYTRKCNCRKPATGLIQQAVDELKLSLDGSYMIGDKLSDIDCGINAGLKTVLVRTGYGKDTEYSLADAEHSIHPDRIVDSLIEAVEWIKHDLE